MAGILTSLPLALGLMNIPDVPEGPIQYRWGDKDVPIDSQQVHVWTPSGFSVASDITGEPSANVEDRRYMTTAYNPFMSAADRLGPQGYYISAERKAAIELGKERKRKAEEKLNRLFELRVGAQSPPS